MPEPLAVLMPALMPVIPSPLALAGLAVVLALLSSLIALPAGRRPWLLREFSLPLLGLAGLVALGAGLGVLIVGQPEMATLPLGLPWQPWSLRLDALSGWFLVIIGLVTGAVGVYGPAYVRDFEHGHSSLAMLGVCTGLFVAGMLLVVLAADAFLFMVAWELMSLASYPRRRRHPAQHP